MVLPGKLQQGQAMSSFQQNTAPKASKFSTLCVTEMKSPWAQPQAADPSAGPWGTSGSQSHTASGIAALRPARQEPREKVEIVQKSHQSGVWPWAAAQPCGTVPPPCPCHQHGPCPRTRPAPGGEGAKAAILDSPQAFPRVAAAALPISALNIMALSGNINNSTTARHHTIHKERPRPALPLSNPLLPAPRSCLAAVQLLRCLQKRVLRELHAQLMRNPGTSLAEDEKS